jgi:hypothetical protein
MEFVQVSSHLQERMGIGLRAYLLYLYQRELIESLALEIPGSFTISHF